MIYKILDIVKDILPTLVVACLAYYFFQLFFKNENNRRKFQLQKDFQKETLPLQLQAFERLALFLERINPAKILIRVPPFNDNANDYEALIIHTIEQEFEHNLTQQIYVSDDCWTIINTAKNTTIQWIRKSNTKGSNAQQLRENILSKMVDIQPPTHAALQYLKTEVKQILT
jgi:hypothetical protein